MVTKGKILKIPGGSEKDRCYYPIRCDIYNKGCKHNCIYCYSRANNSRFKNQWNTDNISSLSIKDIEKLFYNAFETTKVTSDIELLRRKVPLRLGGVSDLFQECEKHNSYSYKLIKLLNTYDYPYLIVTKGDIIGEDEYINILRKDLAYIQISVTSLDEKMVKMLEPGAPTTKKRLEVIQKLIKSGIYTAARVSPIIPVYPDGYYSNNMNAESKQFNYFSFKLIEEICQLKPNTLIAEFLRVSPMIKKILIENNMKEITELFNQNSSRGKDGTLHLSLLEKKYYLDEIKQICDTKHVNFSVCEDYYFEELKEYWYNQKDCCNGLWKIENI